MHLPRLYEGFPSIFQNVLPLFLYMYNSFVFSDNFTSNLESKHFFPLKKYIKLQKHDVQGLKKTKQTNLKIFMNFKSFKIQKSVYIRLQEF